jgi:hypothetical protein
MKKSSTISFMNLFRETLMLYWFEQYYKHSALNFGQALQGIRYIHSHPDIDSIAPRGSIRHFILSVCLRLKRVLNDLLFAILPPDWHHTPEQLAVFRKIPTTRWFQYGYCAWRFTDNGKLKEDVSNADRRWDPRCKNANS